MTDITSFPAIPQVLVRDNGNIGTFTASGTIVAGQVVAYADTGVSKTVVACVAGSGTKPIGVALGSVTDGKSVAVACDGCWVNVAVADDTTGVDAGHEVEWNDNTVGGTVSEVSVRAGLTSTVIDGTNDTTVDTLSYIIGRARDDIAGGSYGVIEIGIDIYVPSDHTVV